MNELVVTVYMIDGTKFENVQIIMADQVHYSHVRHRHGWPTLEEDELLGTNFMAYAALKRLGLVTGSWDEFILAASMIAPIEVDAVDPTLPETSTV